jgi:hypothetical protein
MKPAAIALMAGLLLAPLGAGAADESPPNPTPNPPGPTCAFSGGWDSCKQNMATTCGSGAWSINLVLTGPQHNGCWLHVVSGSGGSGLYHLQLGDWADPNRHSQCDPYGGMAAAVRTSGALRFFDCQAPGGPATHVTATYRANFSDCVELSASMALSPSSGANQ